MNISIKNNYLLFTFDFDQDTIDIAKKKLGMRWSPARNLWHAQITKIFIQSFLKFFPEFYNELEKYAPQITNCEDYSPSDYLRAHQAGSAALGNSRYGVWHDIGVGKTVLAVELMKQKDVKTLVLSPLSIIEETWLKLINQFDPERLKYTVNLWALNQKNSVAGRRAYKDGLKNCKTAIINFESFKSIQDDLKQADFKMLLIDECFVADTLVDTSDGIKKIADIKVGNQVINCIGLSKVKAVKKRYIENDSLSLTTIQKIDIISSKNHLFFTQRGWVKAKNLMETDYVIYTKNVLRMVRERIDQETNYNEKKELQEESSIKNFLLNVLFSEMENDTARNKSQNIHPREKQKIKSGTQSFLPKKQSFSAGSAGTSKAHEYNVESDNTSESICDLKKNGTQTEKARRKRKINPNSSAKIIQETSKNLPKSRLEIGICSSARKVDKGIPKKLQTRYSKPNPENRNRSRWLQPQSNRKTASGQEKNGQTFGARVESTKIYESSDPVFDRYRDKRGRIVLYDLEIEKHPSFSIHGILVHNSTYIKNHRSQTTEAVINFSCNMDFAYPMSGNPAPNSEMEYWPQTQIIDPTLFGTNFYAFRNRYFYSHGYGNFKWSMKENMRKEFLDKLASVSEVIRKEDVLDLPEKTENVRKVYLNAAERKAYEEMKKHLVIEFGDKEVIAANAAVKLMKLREGTSGFYLDAEKNAIHVGNSKLNELEKLIEEVRDNQMIIWTHFHYEADQIEKLFQKTLKQRPITWGRVDGTIKKQDVKNQIIRNFKQKGFQFMVAHPGSLGRGQNLFNCSYMTFFSLSHSHDFWDQCSGRIYRDGQLNKCSYYYLVAVRSVDEVIMKALLEKDSVVKAVFDYIKGERG